MAEREGGKQGSKKPFFEHGYFKATVAVVGLLGAFWALIGAPKPWEVAGELAANPLPLRNTEIVLDASARMGAPFGKTTKLGVEAEAVKRLAASNENAGLALRAAGGDCAEHTEPIVGFDDEHGDDVAAAAGELEAGGKSNWGLAVETAIDDFAEDRFHRPGAENQIAIFVGGRDECESDVGRELRHKLQDANVKATEIKLFAVKVPPREMKKLRAIKHQLAAVAPVTMQQGNTVKELYREAVEATPGGAAGGSGQVKAGAGPGRGAAGAEAGTEPEATPRGVQSQALEAGEEEAEAPEAGEGEGKTTEAGEGETTEPAEGEGVGGEGTGEGVEEGEGETVPRLEEGKQAGESQLEPGRERPPP